MGVALLIGQIYLNIPMSEEDLQELMHQEGKEFNWTFDGVNVRIFKEEYGDGEE